MSKYDEIIKKSANELADWIENGAPFGDYETAKQAATMLRQQQAEIEALKQTIDANNLSQNIGQFVKPTNEPVAWRCKKFYETQEGWFYNENEIGEPLYTHQYERPYNKVLVPCDKLAEMQAEIEALKDFAIWMTGCGYDFRQHIYYNECFDKLLMKEKEHE